MFILFVNLLVKKDTINLVGKFIYFYVNNIQKLLTIKIKYIFLHHKRI
jgi:hypothetical protein